MNRDIKLRVWDSLHKEMVIEKYEADKGHVIEILLNQQIGLYKKKDSSYVNNPFVFMQYTRWKDKNLVDIYEDDIVRSSIGNDSDIFVIDMNKLDWFISPKGHAFDNSSIEFEVIGNIYENQELLS